MVVDDGRRQTLQGRGAGLLCTVLAFLVAACSKAPTAPAASASATARQHNAGSVSAAFLYAVNCDARVDKLDLVNRKVVASFHLSERSGSPPAVTTAPDGKMDGCLAQRVVSDGQGSRVGLIAPKSARLDSAGLQEFQALMFQLPDWRLTATLPAGRRPEAPHLMLDSDLALRVVDDAQWNPVTLLDLGKYKGQDAQAGGLLLASSGHMTLLSLLSSKPGPLALGLADLQTLTLTRLVDVPTTNLGHVHLAPGGAYVLVETTETADSNAKTTGALVLYDSSGVRVGQWQDEGTRNMRFVALTPKGDAVYRAGSEYHFVAMGRSFSAAAVSKPMPDLVEPGLVFSAQ
jgi:hypothetical protein